MRILLNASGGELDHRHGVSDPYLLGVHTLTMRSLLTSQRERQCACFRGAEA